jgi:hypothetical protein
MGAQDGTVLFFGAALVHNGQLPHAGRHIVFQVTYEQLGHDGLPSFDINAIKAGYTFLVASQTREW